MAASPAPLAACLPSSCLSLVGKTPPAAVSLNPDHRFSFITSDPSRASGSAAVVRTRLSSGVG